jgi:CheY-like chemotaxis protein
LVLEDHLPTLEFLRSTLESFLFQVTSSASIIDGIALQAGQTDKRFDLVLIDSNLTSGLVGLEKLQAQSTSIQLILLLNADETLPPVAGIGVNRTLIKPVTRSQLFDAIMQTFGRQTLQYINPEHKMAGAESSDLLHGRQVLLVEDNEINQLVAVDMLENMGMKVSVANNAEEAVQMVQAGNFEVLLMDIQMPGMDGYQATALIRSDPRFSFEKLPIIAMTAHALLGDREKTLAAGLNDYVSKPVSLDQLTHALLRWMAPHPRFARDHNDLLARNDSLKILNLPTMVDTINTRSALERLGGNETLYMKLLALFRDSQDETLQALRTALQNDPPDLLLARRLAHNLKGVAGTIGADMLSATAKDMENAIEQGNTPLYEELLTQLQQKLAIVMASLGDLLKKASDSAVKN